MSVLLHSKTGVTRATTVLLAYLALFKGNQDWDAVPKMRLWLRQYIDLAEPNIYLVEKVVAAHKEFQAKQKPLFEFKPKQLRDREQKTKEDELEEIKRRLDREEQERLRLEREAEIRELEHKQELLKKE